MCSITCYVGYSSDAPMLAHKVRSLPWTKTAHLPVAFLSVIAKNPSIPTDSRVCWSTLPDSSLPMQPTNATLPALCFLRMWLAALAELSAAPPGVSYLPSKAKSSSWIPKFCSVTSEARPCSRLYFLWRILSSSSTVISRRGFSITMRARSDIWFKEIFWKLKLIK